MKGFGLKVTPAGSKKYIFQYRIARPGRAASTAPKKYTIGDHGSFTPEQARKEARALAAMVEGGIDPRQKEIDDLAAADEASRLAAEAARIDRELAFGKFADSWLDHYENEKERRSSSVRLAKLVVNRYLKPALGSKPMPAIGRSDLQPIIDGIPAKKRGTRRAVFAYASVLFSWAHKRGDIAVNPVAAMPKPEAPKARERVLSDAELRDVWNATFKLQGPFGPFFRLLILTGQRRSEVMGMAWGELDRQSRVWTIPAARAKNGAHHIVPLSEAVIAEFDRLSRQAQEKAMVKKVDPSTWPDKGWTCNGFAPVT